MESFRLDRSARSFRLEKADENAPDGGRGLFRRLSALEVRRGTQWFLLIFQGFLVQCICADGMVFVFVLACGGLVIDLLAYYPSWGVRRPADWLFAAARTALAAVAMAAWW